MSKQAPLSPLERLRLAVEGLALASRDAWERMKPVRAACARQAERTRAWPLAWGTFYVVLFCLFSYAVLDKPVARVLKASISRDVEGFFQVITRLGQAEFFLVPAGLLWIGFMVAASRAGSAEAARRFRRLAFPPAFLFLSVAVSGLISNAIKISLGRFRPRYLFESGLYGFSPFNTQWGMNSFPSGHTQAAFAAMTALALMMPRYDVMWFAIAVLVGLSRVATTVHYLSDAVAGGYLAIAVTVVIHRLFTARGIDVTLGRPYKG